jgi:hypothetical protein
MTARRKTAARGYGTPHQRLRAYWKPIVEAGQAECHAERCLMPSRWIIPGTPWDLGHQPGKAGYRGPEHRRCNRHEGQRMSVAIQRAQRALRAPQRTAQPARYTRW